MCLGAIVLLLAGSWLLAPRPSGEEEGFAGTDSTVSRLLEESGTTPWFHPVFTPGSGEIESGLFALQAALGAGLFGYAVGRLHGRHRVPPPSRDGAGPAAGTAPGAAPNAAPDRGR